MLAAVYWLCYASSSANALSTHTDSIALVLDLALATGFTRLMDKYHGLLLATLTLDLLLH